MHAYRCFVVRVQLESTRTFVHRLESVKDEMITRTGSRRRVDTICVQRAPHPPPSTMTSRSSRVRARADESSQNSITRRTELCLDLIVKCLLQFFLFTLSLRVRTRVTCACQVEEKKRLWDVNISNFFVHRRRRYAFPPYEIKMSNAHTSSSSSFREGERASKRASDGEEEVSYSVFSRSLSFPVHLSPYSLSFVYLSILLFDVFVVFRFDLSALRCRQMYAMNLDDDQSMMVHMRSHY